MSNKILTTPCWFRCTFEQGFYTKDYAIKISLNKINLNSRFERKIKTLKQKKTLNMR